MSNNQPIPPVEYEPMAVDQKDSFIDRCLIAVGDMVIRNFTFLVIITVVWGIFLLIFFGGIALIYTVSERFRDIEERAQQRQILHDQQLEQVVLSAPTESQETDQWDDTTWFSALNETVAFANGSNFGELDSEDLDLVFQNQPATLERQLIADDQVWHIECGDAGFVYNDSYPCPITNASLSDPDSVAEDLAASN